MAANFKKMLNRAVEVAEALSDSVVETHEVTSLCPSISWGWDNFGLMIDPTSGIPYEDESGNGGIWDLSYDLLDIYGGREGWIDDTGNVELEAESIYNYVKWNKKDKRIKLILKGR